MSFLSKIRDFFSTGKGYDAFPLDAAEAPHIQADTELFAEAWDAIDRLGTTIGGFSANCNDAKYQYIADLINYPNDEDSRDSIMYGIIEDQQKASIGYVVLTGSGKEPASMYRIPKRKVTELKDQADEVLTMTLTNTMFDGTYRRLEGTSRFTRDGMSDEVEIVRIKLNGNKSPLNSVRNEIYAQQLIVLINNSLLKNGGKTSMWINWKDNIGQDEVQDRIASIRRAISGAKYGSVFGTSSEATINDLGTGLRDMDFEKLNRIYAQRIYLACGIPLPLVFNDAATENNLENAKEVFYLGTCIPYANEIYWALTKAILLRSNTIIDKKMIGCVTVNESEISVVREIQLRNATMKKEAGAHTLNEIRGPLGLESVGYGDTLYIPTNMMRADRNYES